MARALASLSRSPLLATAGEQAGGLRIPRPQRWSVPFADEMSDEQVDALLARPPFSLIDASRFPPRLPLRGVLKNDTRLRLFQTGDIVVREGDYGNSAFIILSGSVQVALDSLPARLLGRRTSEKKTWWSSFSQLWTNHRESEVRSLATDTLELALRARRSSDSHPHVFLQDLPRVMPAYKTVQLEAGEVFGEIAALGRTPRTSTVIADGNTELLEIRWQGLRELRLFAPQWKEHIDRLFRERALLSHLHETPLLSFLDEAALNQVAAQTQFETYGHFDWTASFQNLAGSSAQERVLKEPVIAREGDYPNSLILLRTGFARLSQTYNRGERTLSYLGKGRCFGLEEILLSRQAAAAVPFRYSLRALGYVDVLVIPATVFESIVLPTLTPERLKALGLGLGGDAPARTSLPEPDKLDPALLEFLVENRFINGSATMLIDVDRCTRCDDCVRACAATHDGNPRFIRQGPVVNHLMVANACMHCFDPVCMIGCPTGAISRDSFEGQIVINDGTCIGCGTCASSCPYHNIHLVPVRDATGAMVVDEASQAPIVKATKCDLCIDQLGGPACVRACPHDAMVRADMRDVDFLSAWMQR